MPIRISGHHTIQTATPSEDPITVGHLWTDTTTNTLKICTSVSPYTWTAISGGSGDVSGPASSVDSEIALFDSTTGKIIKRATGTGVAKATAGVFSVGNVSLTTEVTGILPVANGGTNVSSASITAFNNITGFTAAGATGTTSTNLVFSTSPTLVTPALGTPASGVLTNCTGLPIAGGGTGQITATAAFDALAPTTTLGDISYHNGTDNVRLAAGTSGQKLQASGAQGLTWDGTLGFFSVGAGTATGHSPADATTYYVGGASFALAPGTSDNGIANRHYAPFAFTVTSIYVAFDVGGTLGSAGNVAVSIRKNGTTEASVGNIVMTGAVNTLSNTAMSFAVAQGDTVYMKFVTPTWTTNPTTAFYHFIIGYEVP